MKKSPLPSKYTFPEQTVGKRNQHTSLSFMEVPDIYHHISEIPLRKKIETWKKKLCEAYCFISHPKHTSGNTPPFEIEEEKSEEIFQQEYVKSCNAIKSGQPASKYQEHIRSVLCGNVEKELQNIFSAAFIWIVCADLLEEEGLRDQSWASLLEFASLEHRLELACIAEQARREKIRHQENGKKANAKHANLKEYLIEYLHKEAPAGGWATVKTAARDLAPLVLSRHENSNHRAVYEISLTKVERLINNWMYCDEQAKQAFKDNKRK